MKKAKPEQQMLHARVRFLQQAEAGCVLLPWVQGASLVWPGGERALSSTQGDVCAAGIKHWDKTAMSAITPSFLVNRFQVLCHRVV